MSDEETTETPEESETTASTTAPNLRAEIGYFDGELKNIPFNDGDNLQTLLNKSGLNFGDGQSINDEDGNDVLVSDRAENGKTYFIVGNYKQGK